MRAGQIAVALALAMAVVAAIIGQGEATPLFAAPAFETQWRAGEAIAPNFWGPLETVLPLRVEPYKEAVGEQRTVQYFDKARMELASDGTVTNGLLATELLTGQIQTGNSQFEMRTPAAAPMAGITIS